MPIEQFSNVGLYSSLREIEQRLAEGFTTFAFGRGPWIVRKGEQMRLVALFAFFHPDGRVASTEHFKLNDGITNVHCLPQTNIYSSVNEFERLVKKWNVQMNSPGPLAELVAAAKAPATLA